MSRLGRSYAADEIDFELSFADELLRAEGMRPREVARWLRRLRIGLHGSNPELAWDDLASFYRFGYSLEEAASWCAAGCSSSVAILCGAIGRTVEEAAVVMSAIDDRGTDEARDELNSWLTSDLSASRIAGYIRAGVGFGEAMTTWEQGNASPEMTDEQLRMLGGLLAP